jgi:hypothetical protein
VWLLDVLRSPLPDTHRDWFLARCQEKALLIPPEPTPPINSLLVSGLENKTQKLTLILFRLLTALQALAPSTVCVLGSLELQLLSPKRLFPSFREKIMNIHLLSTTSIYIIILVVGLSDSIKYGVHFCTSDALRELKRLGFYVEILDLSHVGSGTKAIDDFYLQVLERVKISIPMKIAKINHS